jgi:alpha-pyrone synthase
MTVARITAIGTAVPDHDIHHAFVTWAAAQLKPREHSLFMRMAKRSAIGHRWSVLEPTDSGGSPVDVGGFYAQDPPPFTGMRMTQYAKLAPELTLRAIENLGQSFDANAITHLIVASCTGFTAPGIDQIITRRLGLDSGVERTLIGFMGCYAAVTALRNARHIVRSEPDAQVLVITVELSTLHLQHVQEIEPLLAMLHFGDGAAAAIVSAKGHGLAINNGISVTLPDSEGLIQWSIGDNGFAMHLSGEVPGRIAGALSKPDMRARLSGADPIDSWAVHAGGRTILDAVESGLELQHDALAHSRTTLQEYGNMSSATLMFTLARVMQDQPENGVALAFGPGLAAEGFRYGWTV